MRINNYKQKNVPDLVDILESIKSDILKTINCVKVGQIKEFNTARQTANIELSIKKVIEVAEDGTEKFQEYPLLMECPVFMLTGGNSHITVHPQSGDTCLVFFNDRDIDNWFVNGGVTTPNTYRTHDLSDGFCLVGVRNLQNAISDFLENGLRIRLDETSQIDMLTGVINMIAQTSLNITSPNVNVSGIINCAQVIPVNGWSGSFATGDSRTVTVVNGIITNVA